MRVFCVAVSWVKGGSGGRVSIASLLKGRSDLIGEMQVTRAGILGRVLGIRRFRNREHRRLASQEAQRDLPRRRTVCARNLLQQPPATRAGAGEAVMSEGAVGDGGHPVLVAPR